MTQSRKTYRISYAGSGALCVRMHDRAALPLHSAMDRTAVFFSAYDGGKQCIGKSARGALRGTLEEENIIMMKRQLALAVAIAAIGTNAVWMNGVSAAEKQDVHGGGTDAVDTYELDPVDVEGERVQEAPNTTLPGGFLESKPSVGLLGNQDVMDAPFTVSSMSQKAIQTFSSPSDGVNGTLTLNPSVRVMTSHLYQDIAVRGFRLSGHALYVNGIPGLLAQYNIPYYWVDSVSVISGPNIGVSGTIVNEAVGGTVNFTSKKAEREALEARLSYLGGKSVEEAVDVGNRFGRDKRWGVRVTATNVAGETAVKHERLLRQNIFVNLDQHTTHSHTNLLLGYNHTKHNAGPMRIGFEFGSGKVTHLIPAPKLSRSYKPEWSYNEYDNFILALNHDQKLSEHLTAFLNAGYHLENWYGYVDGSPTVINNNGDFNIAMENYPLYFTRTYVGVGLRGDFKTGSVRHDYLVGVDRNWRRSGGAGNVFWRGTGNIYRDNTWDQPDLLHGTIPHNNKLTMTGWHVVDTMKAFDEKLQLTIGFHGHSVKVSNAGKSTVKSDAISPTVAVSWKFTPDVMAYAAHSESFNAGSTVGTSYKNKGETLDPAKTKQNEIGVKVKSGNFLHTLSLFQIRQANSIDVQKSDGVYLENNGERENKGAEWAFTGSIADRWDLVGGVSYSNFKQTKTKNGANDGKGVDGMPRWTGTMGIVYHPSEAWSVIGRMNYVGSGTINNGVIRVPSHVLFDLGAAYQTKIDKTPVTFRAMLYNVAGKDYWSMRDNSTSLALGAPRTFTFSANFEL